MKSKFMSKFFPHDYVQRIYVQMQNCKQGTRSVEEYIVDFIRLNSRNLLPNNENMQIAWFRGGLKREIQDQMKMLNSFTLGQAFDLARKAEESIISRPPAQPVTEVVGVENCHRRVATNLQQQSNPHARPMPSVCYCYHLPGHRSNQCPQRPSANFMEAKYVKEDKEDLKLEIVKGIKDDRDFFVGMVQRARMAEIIKGNEEDDISGLDVERKKNILHSIKGFSNPQERV
ncbi:hypothetical protein ACOSQ4_010802 [Xanthoceras sorbifolium]